MATPKEYLKRLNELSNEGFEKYKKDFGGDFETREQYARDYIDNLTLQYERRLCQLLGLQTENEKNTAFNRVSSIASIRALKLSRIAVIVSAIAVIVAIVTLVIND